MLALAPLMSTPSPPVIVVIEHERDSERGVPTLRGLATEEALASVRRREQEQEQGKERPRVHEAATVLITAAPSPEASVPTEVAAVRDEARESEEALDNEEAPRSGPAAEPELAYEPYEPRPKERGGGWAIVALGIAILGGGAYLAMRSPAEGRAVTREATVSSAPAPTHDEPAPAWDSDREEAGAERMVDASYAGGDAGLPAAIDAGVANLGGERGVLLMPLNADSHRVYVDGRLAGVPPPPIVIGCGKHVVKIGSQGREQSVIVPCGGSVSLTYP